MNKALNLQKKGRLGEQLAVKYLLERGFCILNQNQQVGRYEIDIIAIKEEIIFFFEVKTSFQENGFCPAVRIDKIKIAHLYRAALQYLKQNAYLKEFRMEAMAVYVDVILKKATIERFDLSINGGNL